ncbi:hypothetical protein SLE2022_090790 [Rubroshorea leprosula]
MKCYYSFHWVFIFLCSMTRSSNVINQACKDAANSDPNINYEFCVSCLEQNVERHNASSLEELLPISMDLAITNGTNVSSHISNLLADETLDGYTQGCLRTCLELYSDAVSELQDARIAFELKDYATANGKTSAAMDAPSTCEDSFKEGGLKSPLTTEDLVFFKMTAIPLAFLSMIH